MALSKRSIKKTVRELQSARDKAKQLYAKANELTEKLMQGMKPGVQVDLGDGVTVEIVDNFATKNKVWKPCGVNRFDVKVSHANAA